MFVVLDARKKKEKRKTQKLLSCVARGDRIFKF